MTKDVEIRPVHVHIMPGLVRTHSRSHESTEIEISHWTLNCTCPLLVNRGTLQINFPSGIINVLELEVKHRT